MLDVVQQSAFVRSLRDSQAADALVDGHQRNSQSTEPFVHANEKVVLVRRSHMH
jgi:hypothetical protein